jgi:hypothetical protein
MSKTEKQRAMELLDAIAIRQERMRVALEAIAQECGRGDWGGWRERIGDLAALGLRGTDG